MTGLRPRRTEYLYRKEDAVATFNPFEKGLRAVESAFDGFADDGEAPLAGSG